MKTKTPGLDGLDTAPPDALTPNDFSQGKNAFAFYVSASLPIDTATLPNESGKSTKVAAPHAIEGRFSRVMFLRRCPPERKSLRFD